jgi:hypothetical protein
VQELCQCGEEAQPPRKQQLDETPAPWLAQTMLSVWKEISLKMETTGMARESK